MPHAYIGIGSNLDNPELQVRKAIDELKLLPESEYLCNSSCYFSKPVGPPGQPDYVNAVVKIDTRLKAMVLLETLQSMETRQGRTRQSERWGPRIIDLDILLYGDEKINDENLVVPHPEMHKRDFVIIPLYEISPDLVIPEKGALKDLLGNFNINDIKKIDYS